MTQANIYGIFGLVDILDTAGQEESRYYHG